MYSPLLNIVFQYAGSVLAGILVAVLLKAYFASKMHRKIKDYQGEIVKNHARILELEALNYRLEKKLSDGEKRFSKEAMMMN